MFSRRFKFKRHRPRGGFGRRRKPGFRHSHLIRHASLADVPAGCKARILGFTRSIPAERMSNFQAYGLVPGHQVRVLQHSPVTVVEIEHTELALERQLAQEIQIEQINS